MANIFEKQSCERIRFVIVTGGSNPQVKMNVTGVEAFLFGAVLFNKISLTPRGIIRVFGEDNSYRGYIKRDEHGIPRKHLPDPIDENTSFEDWFTIVK